jgi:hypothetical protein
MGVPVEMMNLLIDKKPEDSETGKEKQYQQ